MCDLQDLANAFDRLIKPRPQSVEEISVRLRSTNYQAFESDDVPAAQAQGWVYSASLGNNRVLMHRGLL